MFRSLLVPLDGTPEGAVALPVADVLASATRGAVTLLRVARDASEVGAAGSYLARIASELEGGGFQVDSQVRVGAAATEIVAEARERGADLIAMASHGPGGLGRVVPVSVTGRVIEESRVPVLVARPGRRRVSSVDKLLVPVDGTPGGAVALAVASGLACRTGAEIVLLQVVVPLPGYVYESALGMPPCCHLDQHWDEAALQSAEGYVRHLAADLRRQGLRANGHAMMGRMGSVAETIVQTAEQVDTDLIVMSTHGLTAPVRSLLGSVAEAVAGTAGCPVLLVRRESMAHRAGVSSAEPAAVPC